MNPILRGLGRNMRLTAIAAFAFAAAIPLGLLVYPMLADRMPALLRAAFGGLMDGPTWMVILKVFIRNTTASIIILLLGITIIPALIVLFANGLIVGLVLRFSADKGLEITSILLGIIPHGIFELPALFVCAALGMRIGLELITQRGRRLKAAWEAAKEAAAIYLVTVPPLLMLAAFVEILVSKNLIK